MPICTDDLNCDGVVDGADLGILLGNWTGEEDPPEDPEPTSDGYGPQMAGDWTDDGALPGTGGEPQATSGGSNGNVPWVIAEFGFDSVPAYIAWLESLSPPELWQHIIELLQLIQE